MTRVFYERSGSSSTNCQMLSDRAGHSKHYARLKNRVFPRAYRSQMPTGAGPSRSTDTAVPGGIAGANGARLIRPSARANVASIELS
jgi:hypothetical protein